MSQIQHTFVRADAGTSIGIGHLRRCAILAAELNRRGTQVVLVTHEESKAAGEYLRWADEICWIGCGEKSQYAADLPDGVQLRDAEQMIEVIQRYSQSPSWVILDSDRLGYPWEATLRKAGQKVLAIDDVRSRKHCADIVVSDSLAPFDDEMVIGVSDCRTLCGRQYALVEAGFSPPPNPRIRTPNKRKSLLISYGGSDPTNETLKAIHAIEHLQKNASRERRLGLIDIVVGPLNMNGEDLAAAAQAVRGAVLHRAPASLDTLMVRADLVLTAGGNSLIEALVMCKPCIVTITGKTQEATVDELARDGVIASLEWHQHVTSETVARAIVDAVDSYTIRFDRIRAHAPYDHHGAHRIADEMARYHSQAVVPSLAVH